MHMHVALPGAPPNFVQEAAASAWNLFGCSGKWPRAENCYLQA